jgi:hypothetical protein
VSAKTKIEEEFDKYMTWGKYALFLVFFAIVYAVWCILQALQGWQFGSFMLACFSVIVMPLCERVQLVRVSSVAPYGIPRVVIVSTVSTAAE